VHVRQKGPEKERETGGGEREEKTYLVDRLEPRDRRPRQMDVRRPRFTGASYQ